MADPSPPTDVHCPQISDAQLLAPEEIFDKQKAELVATSEKTQAERKVSPIHPATSSSLLAAPPTCLCVRLRYPTVRRRALSVADMAACPPTAQPGKQKGGVQEARAAEGDRAYGGDAPEAAPEGEVRRRDGQEAAEGQVQVCTVRAAVPCSLQPSACNPRYGSQLCSTTAGSLWK